MVSFFLEIKFRIIFFVINIIYNINSDDEVASSDDVPAVIKEKLNLLEKILEPWPKVVSLWNDTADERYHIIRSIEIHEYFDKFSCLKHPSGLSLVRNYFTLIIL